MVVGRGARGLEGSRGFRDTPTSPHQLSHLSLRCPSSPRFKLFFLAGTKSVSHYISLKWLVILCNIPKLHDSYIQTYKRQNSNTQSRVK